MRFADTVKRWVWGAVCAAVLLMTGGCASPVTVEPATNPDSGVLDVVDAVPVYEREPERVVLPKHRRGNVLGHPLELQRRELTGSALVAWGDDLWFGWQVCTRGGPVTVDRVRAVATFGRGFRVATEPQLGREGYALMGMAVEDYVQQPLAIGSQITAVCGEPVWQSLMVRLTRTGTQGGGIAGLEVQYHDEHGRPGVYQIPYSYSLCGSATQLCPSLP